MNVSSPLGPAHSQADNWDANDHHDADCSIGGKRPVSRAAGRASAVRSAGKQQSSAVVAAEPENDVERLPQSDLDPH